MTELIKVSTNHKGTQFVSAKELFDFLGLDKSQWARWYNKNIVTNAFAIENIDWKGFDIMSNGNRTKDFSLSLDFAKRLAMMAKTETGEVARQYFLECERKSKSSAIALPSTKELAMMVVKAEEEKEQLQKQIQIDAPKVLFANSVSGSNGSVLMAGLSKILAQNGIDMGQNKLFAWMRENGYLGTKGEYYNEPNQRYVEQGLFEVIVRASTDPKQIIPFRTTKITGKGQIYFVNKFLQKQTA